MNFGPVQPELLPGARNAIDTCLAILPDERVALIADVPSKAYREEPHVIHTDPDELGSFMANINAG